MLVAAVGVGVVVALGGDDDATSGPDLTTTTTTLPVSETGNELLDRLAEGRTHPLHVRLEATATEAAGSITVELWRDGDKVRQDVTLVAGDVRTELRAFELPSGNVLCQRASAEEWQCQPTVSTASESGDPAGIVEAAAAQLGGKDVTTEDLTVAGEEARCYSIEGGSTMCVTEDGLPVRLAVQGSVLDATEVEREVDAKVFTPPADVESPSSTTT